jgi:hypothetical protein
MKEELRHRSVFLALKGAFEMTTDKGGGRDGGGHFCHAA